MSISARSQNDLFRNNIVPHKVMFLSTEYPPQLIGGVGTHVCDLVTEFTRRGRQILVATYGLGKSTTTHEPNVIIRRVAPSAATYRLLGSSFARQIKAFNLDLATDIQGLISSAPDRPDIIHCHDWYFCDTALKLREMYKVPVVATIHILYDPLMRWWGEVPDPELIELERRLCREADMIITVSQSMRRIIQDQYDVPDERIRVVYNGIDADTFANPAINSQERDRLRKDLASFHDKIVLFAGRLAPQKGLSALFAAAAQVVIEHPEAFYIIAGGVDRLYPTLTEHLLRQYPILENKIKLLGKVERQQLIRLHQIADVAVIPSIYDPCPYAALEAMAAGLPVVTTNVGGLAEIIRHNETGLLVPVYPLASGVHEVDVEQLAAAQHILLSDEHLRHQLGEAAQRHVRNTFTIDTMIQSILHIYEQVTSCFKRASEAPTTNVSREDLHGDG